MPKKITIEGAAATVNAPRVTEGAVAPPESIGGALGVLGCTAAALGLYAGEDAPLRLGRAVSVSIMEAGGWPGVLHADIRIHGATDELWAWMEANGGSHHESPTGIAYRRCSWPALTLTVWAPRDGEA